MIVDALEVLEQESRPAADRALPASWDVTSDSIAAHLATRHDGRRAGAHEKRAAASIDAGSGCGRGLRRPLAPALLAASGPVREPTSGRRKRRMMKRSEE